MNGSNIETAANTAIDKKNSEWRIRLHRQLDGLCDDAESRKGFHGQVVFEIYYEGRQVRRFKTNIGQSVIE